jgi:hypothetical protein
MILTTVWLFFILGTGATPHPQVVDGFVAEELCQAFRANVVQMIGQGLATGSQVTDCVSRVIVTEAKP